MECLRRISFRLFIKILIFVMIAVWATVIVLALKKPESNMSPRVEDLAIFDTASPVTSTAFTSEYKLSAVQYFPSDREDGNGWYPDAYHLVLTDIRSQEEKRMDKFDAWFIYVLSDGEMFYLFVYVYDNETPMSEFITHQIYSFDPKTETLEHMITYGPTNQDEFIGAFPQDIVANGNKFYFINPHSVQVFDAEKKTCEVLYTTEETLVNSYIDNRAKLYQNELFVATDRNELFSIDVLTGKETGRSISFAGTETKLDKYAVPDNFNNFYWVWGDELIYQEEMSSTMVAYDLITGEHRTLYHGIFTILFADEEGMYVNISDAGSNLFYFNPTEQTFEYLGAQQNLPEKLMTDWVCENTYGKIRKWFYRDFLATPGEA